MNPDSLIRQRIIHAAEMFANGLMFWWNWHQGAEGYQVDRFALTLLHRADNKDS